MSHQRTQSLQELRERAQKRRDGPAKADKSFGDRAADSVTSVVGSWRFILVQSALLLRSTCCANRKSRASRKRLNG